MGVSAQQIVRAAAFYGGIVLAGDATMAWAGSAVLEAQSGVMSVAVWETDDGLPNNDVHSLLVDQHGYLWVSTAGGLVRFDGRTFRRPEGTDPGFFQAATTLSAVESPGGVIVFVHDIDAMNRVLAVGPEGVAPHPVDDLLDVGDRVAAVFAGLDESLWLLTMEREWLHWQKGVLNRFSAPDQFAAFHPPRAIPWVEGRTLLVRGRGLEVHEDGVMRVKEGVWGGEVTLAPAAAGGVWVSDGSGLLLLADDGRLVRHHPVLPENMSWPPRLMHETRDGILWMYFAGGGLWRVEKGEASRVATNHPIIRCMTEDQEGNLWVGTTAGGINRIRKAAFESWAINQIDNIGSICVDDEGRIWLGNSGGIWRLDKRSANAAGASESWPSFAHSLSPGADGSLWIGGAQKIFRYRHGVDPHPQAVGPQEISNAFALFRAADGSVWAGCESGPLLRFDEQGGYKEYGRESGYTGEAAQVFGEDASGRLWVGTRHGDLFLLDEGRFRKFPTPLETTGTGILTITPGVGGALWLGTRGRGFLRKKDGGFIGVGIEHGLPDGIIAQTLEADGDFWVGSSNCLFRVALDELEACADGLLDAVNTERIGRADGVAGFFATGQRQPCAWKCGDGRLWFVGRRGVLTTNPADRPSRATAPAAHIDRVFVDGQALSPPFRVPSSRQRLEFRFSSPLLSAPDDLRFRFRLVGLESDWSPVSPSDTAVYPRLPPGEYVFEVASCRHYGPWSSVPARVHLAISPAWWELHGLRVSAVLLGIAGVLWLARQWSNRRLRHKTAAIEQERKLERERARIARDLHDGIGSGLTQLGWLTADLIDAPAEHAHVEIDHLSGKIRNLARDLDAAVWAISPRHDTLASLCSYLCEFASEHFRHSGVRCRVTVSDALPEKSLAPQLRNHVFMATREALHNVLKHANASEVRLDIEVAGIDLLIKVHDNGKGFPEDTSHFASRNGLRNLRDRMRETGGSVSIESGQGDGSHVHLRIPLL